MYTIIAIILFVIFLLIAVIHIYWAFGGKWGSGSVIPTRDNMVKVAMPGMIPTLAVAAGLLSFGVFILVKTELLNIHLPLWLNRYGLFVIAGVFLLRAIGEFKYIGFFKKIRNTGFGRNDTRYYSPLCLLIGILTLALAIGIAQ
jgi:hypothetical protein